MGQIIFNGGNPLDGCPTDYDEADLILEGMNKGKSEDGPMWCWDCGFKLDYDGDILRVSSRFYPPKTHYGPTWDGTVTFSLLGDELIKKKFDCKTLDDLVKEVELFVQ
ncbi:hypothetical protein LCGC14_2658050, partial [marine sediment metagenome]